MAAITAALLALLRPGDTRGAARRRLLHDPGARPRRARARSACGSTLVPTGRAVPAASTASGWCCWRRRPTRAWTSATSPPWPGRARRRRAVAVDNTTATPLGPAPAGPRRRPGGRRGTKALTGHSDLLLGLRGTPDRDLLERASGAWRTPPAASRARSTPGWRTARWPRWTCGWPGRPPTRRRVAELLAGHPAVTGRALAGAARRPGATRSPPRQMRRIPGVVSFDARLDRGGRRGSSRRPGWSRGDRRSAACTPRPTGGPSGATTRAGVRPALLRHRGHRRPGRPTSPRRYYASPSR